MINPKVSVVIVTKNRSLELSHVFGSLLTGSILPDEIVVVDNNSTDQTKQLVVGLVRSTNNIKVNYFNFSGVGYPAIYNFGLKKAKHDYVAFIDDDCVADINWLKEIKKSLKNNPEAAAIMGWCETYYSENVYCQATILFDNEWKSRSIDGNKVLDCEILDNKNVVYNKKFLIRNKLEYDEDRVKYAFGAAQDCDLGIQIQTAGGNAFVNKKILIWHKDPQDWLWFIKKNLSSWHAYDSLKFKWDLNQRDNFKREAKSFNKLIQEYSVINNLSFYKMIKLYLVAKKIMILNRILSTIQRLLEINGNNDDEK